MKAPPPTEDAEQTTVVAWLEIFGIRFFHVPNGEARTAKTDRRGNRYSPAGQRLKKLGAKPGVPDIVIIDPPPRYPDSPGTVVEMKRTKGSKTTDDQKQWLADFGERGWQTAICKGADVAIDYLTGLGYGRARFKPGGKRHESPNVSACT